MVQQADVLFDTQVVGVKRKARRRRVTQWPRRPDEAKEKVKKVLRSALAVVERESVGGGHYELGGGF